MLTFLRTFPLPVLAIDEGLGVVAYSQRALGVFGLRSRGSAERSTAEQLGQALAADTALGDQLALATARLTRPGDEESFSWRRQERTFEVRVCRTEEEQDVFLVILEDDTDRTISEDILFNARHYLEHILSNIPLGLVVLNRDLRITSINRQQLRFLERMGIELSLVDAIGTTLAELLPGGAGPAWHQTCETVLQGDESAGEAKQTYPTERGDLVLSVAAISLPDHYGQIGGVMLTCDDVTEQTRLELELVRVEKLATVGQMVITVNHEINNPLSIISSSAQSVRLLNPDLAEKIVNKLHTIEEQVKRISAVTERLRHMQEVETDEYIASGPQMIDVWKNPPED